MECVQSRRRDEQAEGMVPLLVRHEIRFLRRAGHTPADTARRAGVAVKTVQRVAEEDAVTDVKRRGRTPRARPAAFLWGGQGGRPSRPRAALAIRLRGGRRRGGRLLRGLPLRGGGGLGRRSLGRGREQPLEDLIDGGCEGQGEQHAASAGRGAWMEAANWPHLVDAANWRGRPWGARCTAPQEPSRSSSVTLQRPSHGIAT